MKGNQVLALTISLIVLPIQVRAGEKEDYYHYKLEDGATHAVCQHMTKVFNNKFRTPWHISRRLGLEAVPKTKDGVPYDQLFERLPGVEYKKEFVFDMLLSKYPTSPEFEAVKWVETRAYVDGYDSNTRKAIKQPFPLLLTKLDIDNDGREDWLVKGGFMRIPSRDDNLYGVHMMESIAIFDEGCFDPAKEIRYEDKEMWNGARVIMLEDLHQMRPFVFRQTTYVAAYQAFWVNRINRKMDRHDGLPIQRYPDEEYINVVRVLPGEGEPVSPYVVYRKAETETVCRIRMILLNKLNTKGGR